MTRLRSLTRTLQLAIRMALTMSAKPVIGGQAVIEGVMMRSPKSFAVAVRAPDGGIVVREEPWLSFSAKHPFLRWPLLRGATMLVESMYNGLLALNFSAATAMPDEKAAAAEPGDKKSERDGLWVALLVSAVFALALFKGVPHFSAWGLGHALAHDGETTALPTTHPLFHLVDGGIKFLLFVGYILLISRMNDVKRLFMYHGAEHKSVHAYENNEPLDVAHAATFSTAHPRCGTSLMLIVLVTSILVFMVVLPFVPPVFENEIAQTAFLFAIKIPLLLPIAGLAYEAQRAAARNPKNLLVRALIAPGMLLQRLTTREPGAPELEVALAALRKTVWRERTLTENARGGEVVPLPRSVEIEKFESFDAMAKKVA